MSTPKSRDPAQRSATEKPGQMKQGQDKTGQFDGSAGHGARADAHRNPGGYRQGDTMSPDSRGGHRSNTGNDAGLDGPNRRGH